MRIIEPSASIIREANPLKKIELVGRTCYKSEENITPKSSVQFVRGMFKRHHMAMVEHTAFCFRIVRWDNTMDFTAWLTEIRANSYVRFSDVDGRLLISMNARTLNEEPMAAPMRWEINGMYPDLIDECYKHNGEYNEYNHYGITVETTDIDSIPGVTVKELELHKFMTFRCVTDRGITHEIVRHRPASYGQESTRYCNYGLGKFGREIKVICPSEIMGLLEGGTEKGEEAYEVWKSGCERDEADYFKLLDLGATPQAARSKLPTCLASEICLTMRLEELKQFINLRKLGTTGAPHPDMKVLAEKIYEEGMKDATFNFWAGVAFAN